MFCVLWTFLYKIRKIQQSECVPSEDSDQPGHPPSLIRVFAVRMQKDWVLSYPLSEQRRLWSDWVDAQADLSLRWAHTHLLVLSCRGSYVILITYQEMLGPQYLSTGWYHIISKCSICNINMHNFQFFNKNYTIITLWTLQNRKISFHSCLEICDSWCIVYGDGGEGGGTVWLCVDGWLLPWC